MKQPNITRLLDKLERSHFTVVSVQAKMTRAATKNGCLSENQVNQQDKAEAAFDAAMKAVRDALGVVSEPAMFRTSE